MRKIMLATATLFALTSTAIAGRNDATWDPPARYNHSYHGRVVYRPMTQADVVKECYRLSNNKRLMMDQRGCAKRLSPNVCVVVYANKTYKKATPKAIRRHEIGHCNGWPGNHPD